MGQRITIPQETETELETIGYAGLSCQYAYTRSLESREAGDPGQDYISYVTEENSLTFVVCDGISMSYFGELAAKFLGDALVDWLQDPPESCMNSVHLQSKLNHYLEDCAKAINAKIAAHRIPSHIQGMLREVLQSKKHKGSGTLYVCGRVDLPGGAFPEGRLLLAWQGDIRLRIWSGQTETTAALGDTFHTRHQWNSIQGPVGGSPHVYCGSLLQDGHAGSIMIYTDGLKILDPIGHFTDGVLRERIRQEAQNPSSDDMSLLHIQWALQERLVKENSHGVSTADENRSCH
jgi:hypothetical protein